MALDKNSWLINKPIAHRGLWGENIVENSISSYLNAKNFGYPIEIDVFCSSDGVLYSFHDEDLERMTGVKGKIYQTPSSVLDRLMLNGTNEHIPKLTDVLSSVNGKIPLLIEIKNQPDALIVDRVLDALNGYKGEFALQSFNPVYIKQIKKKAPYILRGLLYTTDKDSLKTQNALVRFIIKKMLFNPIIKPHFLAIRVEDLELTKRKKKRYPIITWTVKNKEQLEKIKPFLDNIIFEGFVPDKI